MRSDLKSPIFGGLALRTNIYASLPFAAIEALEYEVNLGGLLFERPTNGTILLAYFDICPRR